ncbi:hypothetical protein HELRODRAFT_177650 [Helobdella robusta]|uniref:Uncharacterized protein n=1 Tax=Helobdella robusta TaxID=6412 RepID=T1FC06_HELRO|nr:hypothetical protein HELRODRAFT_177650 [Helobdella robusta]ESN97979.1 hypothetical protein HELRODRAFT_177650 [Helobdella robusta]
MHFLTRQHIPDNVLKVLLVRLLKGEIIELIVEQTLVGRDGCLIVLKGVGTTPKKLDVFWRFLNDQLTKILERLSGDSTQLYPIIMNAFSYFSNQTEYNELKSFLKDLLAVNSSTSSNRVNYILTTIRMKIERENANERLDLQSQPSSRCSFGQLPNNFLSSLNHCCYLLGCPERLSTAVFNIMSLDIVKHILPYLDANCNIENIKRDPEALIKSFTKRQTYNNKKTQC